MIVFQNVTKTFDGRTVLDDVSFTIQPGEFVCLTGPSGAGKSTIVHLLIRMMVPSSGSIEVDGASVALMPPAILQLYRRSIGVVFQDYKLLSDRTVEENVACVPEALGRSDAEIRIAVTEILDALGLSHRTDAFPDQLSGGEKTRTALARALVHHPRIVIADEPTGNIDPAQSLKILEILKAANRAGATVILATHDKAIVDTLGVRVLRLEGGTIVRDSVGGYIPSERPREEVKVAVDAASTRPIPAQGRHTPKAPPVPPKSVQSDKPATSGPGSSGHIRPIEIQ